MASDMERFEMLIETCARVADTHRTFHGSAEAAAKSIATDIRALLPDLVEAVAKTPETCADARRAAYIAGLREALAIAESLALSQLDEVGLHIRARIRAAENTSAPRDSP